MTSIVPISKERGQRKVMVARSAVFGRNGDFTHYKKEKNSQTTA